ncbi:MAG: LamG domain-containing protein [Alphaproteobacteria bacterium]|nr:LamG domain-containing protein [Alphaproteobacteria bacterium]
MLIGLLALAAVFPLAAQQQASVTWRFDNLAQVGGHPIEVEGRPRLINTGAGPAVEFNGVDDALFIDAHPLAGFTNFTFEAIFRPDGGAEAQRWFHIASADPKTGAVSLPGGTNDPNPRFLFELRVADGNSWYLDAFTHGDGYNQALMFPAKTHAIGAWHAVAQTYDGKVFRSYVDGVLQGEAAMDFKPQGPGKTSIGTRINRVNYFKGAILEARFTPRALAPEALLTVPASLKH